LHVLLVSYQYIFHVAYVTSDRDQLRPSGMLYRTLLFEEHELQETW